MTITTGTVSRTTQSSVERDYMIEKLPYATGLIKDEPDTRDYLYQNIKGEVPDIKDLPDKGDLSSEMSPVKNQGRAGTCVSFAVAAVKEGQEKKEYLKERKEGSKYKRETPEYDLSEMGIYKNCKDIDDFPDSEGTSIRAGMKVINKLGVPKESAWPYTDDLDNMGKPTSGSKMTSRGKKSKSYHRITNIAQLIDFLYYHGPVIVGVLVFSTGGRTGRGGFVDLPSNERPQGGHAVPIIGYDKGPERARDKKLFFKNSGGTNWGDNGFGGFSWKYGQKYALDTGAMVDTDITREQVQGDYKGLD